MYTYLCVVNACQTYFINTNLYECDKVVFALNWSVQLVFQSSRSFQHGSKKKWDLAALVKSKEKGVFRECSY